MALDVVRSEQGCLRYGVRVNWGGIFFGAFMTLALLGLTVLFGNAIGLAPWKVSDAAASGAIRVLSWIYTFLSSVISFGLGGFFGARLSDVEAHVPDALHGLGAWAVSGVALIVYELATSDGFRQIFHGSGSNSVNWLFICIAWFGALAAAFGGMNSTSGVWVTSLENIKKREKEEFGRAA